MQQKNTSDKQTLKFNVQNNNLHKQVALHLVAFIRSLLNLFYLRSLNFYDNLNSMKLYLNVSRRSLNVSANNRDFSFSLQIRVIISFFQVFCSVFFKGHSPGHLQKQNLLHVSQTIYIPRQLFTYSDSSHIFKILPNFRSTIND